MNKKFLSAILFGALMVTSTGTFVSCKDYDDDIENLQGQISANASAIAELKALIGDGNYVTGISVNGQNLVVNTKNGSTTVALPKSEDKVGSICTVEDGILYIDGVATDIKVCEPAEENEFKPAVEIVDGEWAVLQEDGSYLSTGVAVSSVAVTGNEQDGFVLTIKDAEGNATVVELPTAASAITSIRLIENPTPFVFTLTKATFAKPSSWAGPKTLPANNSVIYSANPIAVRIDPVTVPAGDVTFTLANSLNKVLSHVELNASATQDSNGAALTTGNAYGRAAVTGNGLWTLKMDQLILTKDEAAAFSRTQNDKELDKYVEASTAFAVNVNNKVRSEYGIKLAKADAAHLTKVQIKGQNNPTDSYVLDATSSSSISFTADINKVYTIEEIAGESGLMFDMYFSLTEADKKTYGVVYDNAARTFQVTKNPDASTDAKGFDLFIYTIDTYGQIRKACYNVSLSASIDASSTYEAVEFNIANLYDTNANNNGFTLDMDIMKNALGEAKWIQWANSVDLSKTTVVAHAKADLSDTGKSVASPLSYGFYNANWGGATVSTLKYMSYTVKTSAGDLKLDTQYYLNITFNTTAGAKINNIVVPVKFTAPSVADQFTPKAGYVVDGKIMAYYYDVTKRYVELARYFEAYDEDADLSLDHNSVVVAKSNTDKSVYSSDLATVGSALETATLTLKTGAISVAAGGTISANTTTKKEAGYGLPLLIEVQNVNYKNSTWMYANGADDAKANHKFEMVVMSPIAEGKVVPAAGNTIEISANSTEGFDITKSMITGYDYNNNSYNVVPDATGTSVSDLKWSNEQIATIAAAKGDSDTYINAVTMKGQYKEGDNVIAGAINIKANPLPNTTETKIYVSVTDAWGYVTKQEVSVTIKKN